MIAISYYVAAMNISQPTLVVGSERQAQRGREQDDCLGLGRSVWTQGKNKFGSRYPKSEPPL